MAAAVSAPARPALLARSLALRRFVMLRRVGTAAATPELLDAHLRWVIGEEQAGRIFLSGPLTNPASRPLHGITVLRVADLAEGERVAGLDPFVAAGVVTFELHEWTVFEGAISTTVTLSDGMVTIS